MSHQYASCGYYYSIIHLLPLIYVGIYVDDIIYFSQSDAVEKQFELGLSKIGELRRRELFQDILSSSKGLPQDSRW